MLASSIFEIEHKIYISLKSFPPTIVKWFMYVIFFMHVILDEVKTSFNFISTCNISSKNEIKKVGMMWFLGGFNCQKRKKNCANCWICIFGSNKWPKILKDDFFYISYLVYNHFGQIFQWMITILVASQNSFKKLLLPNDSKYYSGL